MCNFLITSLPDSASTCAAHTKRVLEEQHLLRTARSKPTLEIFLTDLSEQAEAMTKRFLGTDFGKVKKATL